ncbi:hypothetical protein GCM10010191_04660 [Actinomadura vinacea]|uniref:RNA polymerase sigma factor 70 region 4 type 2 domain-containing protein n=1 Tax=Actinomadura vinacea TaxID=115336 RepID=A0ABN3IDW5_9ACTN
MELVAVDGLPVAQAAAALGMSAVAAGVRLHRARKTVRAALDRRAASVVASWKGTS